MRGLSCLRLVVVRLIMMFDEGSLQTTMLAIYNRCLSILSLRLLLLLMLFYMLNRLVGKQFTCDFLFQVTSFLDIFCWVVLQIVMYFLIVLVVIDDGYIEILLV